MHPPDSDRQWRWDGERWEWWNGYSWQEGDPEAADLPDLPDPHPHAESEPPHQADVPLAVDEPTAVIPSPPPPPSPTPPPPPPPPIPATPTPPPVPTQTAPGYQSYQPYQPGPPAKRGFGGAGIAAIVLGGLLAVVVIAGVGFFVVDRIFNADTVTLQTEPLGSTVNAFTPPVSADAPITPVATSGVQNVPAATAGLYGGTLSETSCDKAKLVAYLQANPDLAAAWSGVVGISASQIPAFVAPLTPVLLRSDTAVTNHGYEKGKATAFPSLLQAGTAVLVNQYGAPVVRCYCGNPLTPAPTKIGKLKYKGPTWPTFQPGNFTIIDQSVTVINTFTLVNVVNGEQFERPAGTDGANDVPPAAPAPEPAATAAAPAPAPVPVPVPVPEPVAPQGGRESEAISFAISLIDECTRQALGPATDYIPIADDPDVSFDAYPTGAGPDLYHVTMYVSSTGSSYGWTVNVNTGSVTAADEGSAGIEMECPGVFD